MFWIEVALSSGLFLIRISFPSVDHCKAVEAVEKVHGIEINDQGKRRMESASDNSARSYYFKVLITTIRVKVCKLPWIY